MTTNLTIQTVLAVETPNLRAFTDAQAADRPKPGSWSRKEELGHLIDSASNNHQRFIRAQHEPEYRGPGYAQDDWVRSHAYHDLPWTALVDLWQQYNWLLSEVVKRIPEDRLSNQCHIAAYPPFTLAWVIEDYILHMQHHLDHILRREVITQYPGASL